MEIDFAQFKGKKLIIVKLRRHADFSAIRPDSKALRSIFGSMEFKKYLLDEDGGPVQSISSYVKSLHHAVAAQVNV